MNEPNAGSAGPVNPGTSQPDPLAASPASAETQAALTEELKGVKNPGDTQIKVIDKQDTGRGGPDQLEVGAPSQDPLVPSLDAQHAIESGGAGYEVKVRGSYFGRSKEGNHVKIKKEYAVTVNLPSLDKAMSVLKNDLIDAAVLNEYPDCASVRTINIDSALPRSPLTPKSSNLQFMDHGQLSGFAKVRAVPIDLADYGDAVNLRDALIDFVQNPDGFAKRESEKLVKRKKDAVLRGLNPQIKSGT